MKHWIATIAACLAIPAGAAELGDDGLHKAPWMVETFKDLREDLGEAGAEGKRLVVIVEQRGCIYCTQMHEEVFVEPDIARMLGEDFFVVQMNMFGDVEVTDFDGETLAEKDASRKWRLNFTPTLLFFPEDVPEGLTAEEAAVVAVPGAFSAGMTRNMLNWVLEKGYEGEEPFQAYHARKLGGG
ncbi:thioredoxin family protein [Jannaschia ovalis]|uniref:Thioredoxin family protein n=1 Tax=Jannaschia ovalis TaxID=3038773 RepID=A0ABY8LHH1_9RHOB|nr:thioredoxin family protein [Jannaschia sp. GRR-S6-38]WGH79634.1 thioredoxin family protein [Jannaschia sp. GRR-S6-38]